MECPFIAGTLISVNINDDLCSISTETSVSSILFGWTHRWQFDSYVRSLQIDPQSPLFRLVTDGQLPRRQCLHPYHAPSSILVFGCFVICVILVLQFDSYVRSLQIDPQSPLFRLVTDGQLPLRQCLHPEACSKNIELPSYYHVFHDLRKDFRAFYSAPDDAELNSVTDLVDSAGRPLHVVGDIVVRINIGHSLYSTPRPDRF
ncbi:regulation of RNA splicing [Homalodisca vitripennis]|nr:regulation of RNA splicing [Homalodisca vitripennis]